MTYNGAEPGLEVIDPDVVLDSLQLRDQGQLGLHNLAKLLFYYSLLLGNGIEILVHHDDGSLRDFLNNRQGAPLLRPGLSFQSPLNRARKSLLSSRRCG
jgi:hypothetical protein